MGQIISAVPHLARAELAAVAALSAKEGMDDDATRVRLNEFLLFEKQREGSRYRERDAEEGIEQKGLDFMLRTYRHNLPAIMATWGRHQADFEWLQMRIIYGLFLADESIISGVEMEIAVVPAIMAQDVRGPTYWHVRGLQRLGVSVED